MSYAAFRSRPFRIAICFAAIAILSSSFLYLQTHRYVQGRITFQQYESTYLPEGVSVSNKYIAATYTPSHIPPRTTGLRLELSDGSYVLEGKDTRRHLRDCPKNESVNQECWTGTTRDGETFVGDTSIAPNQPARQSIRWIRGGTSFFLSLENETSLDEIGKIIDSFTPVNFENLEIRYTDRSTV